jgi:hypothetical protein
VEGNVEVVHQVGVTMPAGLLFLLAGLDELDALTPADLAPEQALQLAAAVLVAQDRLRAIALRQVADVEHRQLHDLDGCPSTGSWVAQQHTSMTRAQVALARGLDRVPQVAARIAEGGLCLDGGVLIGQALNRLRPHVDRPDGLIDGQPAEQVVTAVLVDGICQLVGEARGGLDDDHPVLPRLRTQLTEAARAPLPEITRLETGFLLLARDVEPGQLKQALRVLIDAVLPCQLDDSADDADRNRSVDLRKHDDRAGWSLRGELDDETGELLHTVLAATMTVDPDNVSDTAAARKANQAGEDDVCLRVRSRRQRRHDALRLLLQQVLGSKVLGTRSKLPVQINVTISNAALHGQPGALPARTGSGASVPSALVRRWLCDSAITRFVLSLGNKVIELSHTERTAKPHERRIKLLETGGTCQGAGCYRGHDTGDVLVPHHPDAYARTGITSLRDTVMLCDVTHHELHEGHKTIRLKDGRLLNENGWVLPQRE